MCLLYTVLGNVVSSVDDSKLEIKRTTLCLLYIS